MWTRVELKSRAKENLRKYYWAAFAVSLILSLASSVFSLNIDTSNFSGSYRNHIETEYGDIDIRLPDNIGNISRLPGVGGTGMMKVGGLFYGFLIGAAVVIIILGLLMNLFVIPALTVGSNRFYMESRLLGRSAGVGRLFWGFTHNYLNIILTIFLMELFIALGTICCVVPGIYLSYCYRMVPYILSENPEMKPFDAMRLSKQMMDGHKFNSWILELSFIGWILLGMLACCAGLFFVQPYYQATYAELYAVLRKPFESRLRGFGIPGPAYGNGGYYQNPYHADGYGGWDQNNSGYGQNNGWNQNGSGYGQNNGWDQNNSSYGQNNGWNQNDSSYGQNSGWDQNDSSYGQNSGWNQNGTGYGQNNGWNQNGINYGQNNGWNQNDSGYGQNSGWNQNEGGYGQNNDWYQSGGGYGQNSGRNQNEGGYEQNSGLNGDSPGQRKHDWIQGGEQGQNDGRQTEEPAEHSGDSAVKRSEGGPGEGYYLNGEFHPYTDDEKK